MVCCLILPTSAPIRTAILVRYCRAVYGIGIDGRLVLNCLSAHRTARSSGHQCIARSRAAIGAYSAYSLIITKHSIRIVNCRPPPTAALTAASTEVDPVRRGHWNRLLTARSQRYLLAS